MQCAYTYSISWMGLYIHCIFVIVLVRDNVCFPGMKGQQTNKYKVAGIKKRKEKGKENYNRLKNDISKKKRKKNKKKQGFTHSPPPADPRSKRASNSDSNNSASVGEIKGLLKIP